MAPQVTAQDGVKTNGRLVKHQQVRLPEQCHGKARPGELAAGEGPDQPAFEAAEVEVGHRLCDRIRQAWPRQAEHGAPGSAVVGRRPAPARHPDCGRTGPGHHDRHRPGPLAMAGHDHATRPDRRRRGGGRTRPGTPEKAISRARNSYASFAGPRAGARSYCTSAPTPGKVPPSPAFTRPSPLPGTGPAAVTTRSTSAIHAAAHQRGCAPSSAIPSDLSRTRPVASA